MKNYRAVALFKNSFFEALLYNFLTARGYFRFKEEKIEFRSKHFIQRVEILEAPFSPHIVERINFFITPLENMFIYFLNFPLCLLVFFLLIIFTCVRTAEKLHPLLFRAVYFILPRLGLFIFNSTHFPNGFCHMEPHVSLIVCAFYFCPAKLENTRERFTNNIR